MVAMNGFGKAIRIMHTHRLPRWLARLALATVALGCTTRAPEPNGTCAPDPAVSCAVGDLSAEAANLTGYSCTGTARPDDDATFIDGIPQGIVCADQPVSAAGVKSYCCTNFTTQCSYNPTAICDQEGNYGYQCYGPDRPEALNAAISCNQGVREDLLVNYCCSGAGIATNCIQSDSIGCASGMTGWTCPKGRQPTAQDLGASKSRADQYYLLCPVPTPAPNEKYELLCCYVPTLVPAGGSCLQDMKVPNCAPGRFGIACYGTDNPEQNYPRLRCPDPGVAGLSEQGLPATVYCCDFTRD
jgi:hypothetical protein